MQKSKTNIFNLNFTKKKNLKKKLFILSQFLSFNLKKAIAKSMGHLKKIKSEEMNKRQ